MFDPKSPSPVGHALNHCTIRLHELDLISKPSMVSQTLPIGLGKVTCGLHAPEVELHFSPYHEVIAD